MIKHLLKNPHKYRGILPHMGNNYYMAMPPAPPPARLPPPTAVAADSARPPGRQPKWTEGPGPGGPMDHVDPLFSTFLGISKFRPNLDHWTPYLLQKYVKKTQDNPKYLLTNIMFANLMISHIENIGNYMCRDVGRLEISFFEIW